MIPLISSLPALEFLEPIRLLILIGLPALSLLLFLLWQRRIVAARLLGYELPSFSRARFLPFVVLALLSICVAKPYMGSKQLEIRQEGHDVAILVDVSYSMLGEDESPDRLSVAKRKILDLIERSQSQGKHNRFAIVPFAGGAYLFCPLTSDFTVLKAFVDELSPGLVTSEGTDILAAIKEGVLALSNGSSTAGSMLLLTDGETGTDQSGEIARIMRGLPVKLFTVGIGRTDGTTIPLRGGEFLRDGKGNVVITRLDEANLLKVRDAVKGEYRRVSVDDSDIQQLLDIISSSQEAQRTKESLFTIYNHISPFVALVVLLSIAVALLRRNGALLFPAITLAMFALPNSALSETEPKIETATPSSLYDTYLSYQGGDFVTAREGFSYYHRSEPSNLHIARALADTHVRLKEYKEADTVYSSILKRPLPQLERLETFYNRGTSRLLEGRYRAAIEDFDQALAIDPTHEPSIENREIALMLLEEEQNTPKPTPPPPSSDEDESSSSSSQSQSKEDSDARSSSSSRSASDDSSQSDSSSSSSSPSRDDSDSDSSSSSSSRSLSGNNSESDSSASSDPQLKSSSDSDSRSSNENLPPTPPSHQSGGPSSSESMDSDGSDQPDRSAESKSSLSPTSSDSESQASSTRTEGRSDSPSSSSAGSAEDQSMKDRSSSSETSQQGDSSPHLSSESSRQSSGSTSQSPASRASRESHSKSSGNSPSSETEASEQDSDGERGDEGDENGTSPVATPVTRGTKEVTEYLQSIEDRLLLPPQERQPRRSHGGQRW